MKILPIYNAHSLQNNNQAIKKGNEKLNSNFAQYSNFTKIPCNYFSNINFTSSNVQIIDKMEKIVSSKKYSFDELEKLFKEMTQKAQDNVTGVVEKFGDEGLTVEKYIPACVIQPQLFCQSPDTIESNVRDLVKKFEKEGLTVESYLPACVKQPPLFCQSPDTIESNVRDLVKKFAKEGLTVKKYLPACFKEPSLFAYSPDTIAEHIRAYQYVDKNRNGDGNIEKALKKKLTLSTSAIYLREIIRPQIKAQCLSLSNLNVDGIKPRLKKYFEENPNAQFKIKVIKDKMTDSFIETMQEYCEKDLGKPDAFIFEIK